MKLLFLLLSLAAFTRSDDLSTAPPVTDAESSVAPDAPLTTTMSPTKSETTLAPTTTTTTSTTTTLSPTTTTTLSPTTTTTSAPTTLAPTTTAAEPPITTVAPSAPNDYSVCRADAESFCGPEMASGDRSAICECMRNHLNQLSPACATFVLQKKAEREAAREACGADVTAFCPEAREQGHWAIRSCLREHYSELSSSCTQYIKQKMDQISPDACDADVSTLCPSSVGFSATLTCLKDNMKQLSQDCLRFLLRPSNKTEGWRGEEGERRHHGRHEEREGEDDEHRGWRHGWIKEKWGEHKRERKARREQERLMDACSQNVQALCQGYESVHDIKACLAMNYASLDSDCAEYLITSSDDDDHEHHRAGKMVVMVVGAVFLVSLVCICRKRCKRRRQMWREMQRNMALQNTENTPRYIAVPTQISSSHSQPVQQAQLAVPTAPQPSSPQPSYSQGVVYAASPYTGGIPITAVPVAYNPQAMSIA